MFTDPKILADAKNYFTNVKTKDVQYKSFLTNDTPAATYINKEIQEKYRAEMRKYYNDPSKYGTYLEQLGIVYQTLETK